MRYIVLINWTDQGIRAVKKSPARLDKARDFARALGATIDQAYMTMGDTDMVCIVDAPSDEAFAAFGLKLASTGAVRTRTLKAFAETDYRTIMAGL